YCVPPAVQSCVGRLPSGNVQDLVALYVCKANQISQFTGSPNVLSSFLQAAIQEYRQTSKDIPFDIINEHLHLELINWHESLHKSTDEAKMGQLTSELAAKVKSFIGEYDRTNLPMPSHEMSMLTSAFLLNTCDWDFVIYHVSKNFRSRYMDFSKFISALIINSSTNKAGQVAKEVLEVLLPLCYDPSPRQMLLSRQQFLLIISMIKSIDWNIK
uniref:INTS8 TPR repeats domain-containing protein n=1 Tax=Romanomermis culicivorax TaxID=13658 RepID=A0A915IIH8_ROMCU